MPTDEEWTWLRNNCTWVWTTENGVYGRKVTSNITGNSIFLPSAGYWDGTSFTDITAIYWSSSLSVLPSNAKYLSFNGGISYVGSGSRIYGMPVRPVSD